MPSPGKKSWISACGRKWAKNNDDKWFIWRLFKQLPSQHSPSFWMSLLRGANQPFQSLLEVRDFVHL